MAIGYINRAQTATEFQVAIDKFNAAGVAHSDIVMNSDFESVSQTVQTNTTIMVLNYADIFGSLTEMFTKIIELNERGVSLCSINDPHLNFDANQMHLVQALNALDAKLRTTRTKKGLDRARANGVKLGRPFGSVKVIDKVREVARLCRMTDMTVAKACRLVGCQPRTYYRYLEKNSI